MASILNGIHLWAHIDGEDYPIAYGASFSLNLSETLDSGSVILPHIGKILEAKPYDDIIIHSYGPAIYNASGALIGGLIYNYKQKSFERGKGVFIPNSGDFYHHFLIGNIKRSQVDVTEYYFNYEISLVSETKGLEKIILPNRTITQPREEKGRSVYDWVSYYLDDYCPKIKTTSDGLVYSITNKYFLSGAETNSDFNSNLEIFKSVSAPETSFNNPTFKDVLTRLFNTKDSIPVVRDWMILRLDLSKRNNKIPSVTITRNGTSYNISKIPGSNFRSWMMNGDEYCDRIRRDYVDALSNSSVTTFVEDLGFRNTSVSSMTLQDLKAHFNHKIYKIKKFEIGYYKTVGSNHFSLVYRDITPLIILNSRRSYLSVDWKEFSDNPPHTLEGYFKTDGTYVKGYADYRFCTLGYDIGASDITGWGEFLEYSPSGIFNQKYSYLENIIGILESTLGFPDPINDMSIADGIVSTQWDSITYTLSATGFSHDDPAKYLISPGHWNFGNWESNDYSSLVQALTDLKILTDSSPKIKTIFFRCEYEGYIEGSVQFSKDYHDGDIMSNDRSSESLAIVETDGLFEKEKVNQLGNSVLVTNARITNDDNLLSLGDYDDDDNIIYKISFSYNEGYITANYYQCKDYVLKNYFTSVFSKHRPFALASYEESVSRLENHYLNLNISSDTQNYQASFVGFDHVPSINDIFSFYKPTLSQTSFSHSAISHNWSIKGSVDTIEELKGFAIMSSVSLGDLYLVRYDFDQYNNLVKCYISDGKVYEDEAHSKEITKDKLDAGNIYFDVPTKSTYIYDFANNSADNNSSNQFFGFSLALKQYNVVISSIYRWNGTKWEYKGEHEQSEMFAVECQNYISGNAICYTVSMVDNESMGVYIRNPSPSFDKYVWQIITKHQTNDAQYYSNKDASLNTITGMAQGWYMINEDTSGYVGSLSFSSYSVNEDSIDAYKSNYIYGDLDIARMSHILEAYHDYYLKLPLIYGSDNPLKSPVSQISCTDKHKDAKERIVSTMEIETTTKSKDIFISEWVSKLSQLSNKYEKYWEAKAKTLAKSFIFSATNITMPTNVAHSLEDVQYEARTFFLPVFGVAIPQNQIGSSELISYLSSFIGKSITWDNQGNTLKNSKDETKTANGGMAALSLKINSILSVTANEVEMNVTMHSSNGTNENTVTKDIVLTSSYINEPPQNLIKSEYHSGGLVLISSYPSCNVIVSVPDFMFFSYNFDDVTVQVLGGYIGSSLSWDESYPTINGIKGNVSNGILYDSYEHNPTAIILNNNRWKSVGHFGLYQLKYLGNNTASLPQTITAQNMYVYISHDKASINSDYDELDSIPSDHFLEITSTISINGKTIDKLANATAVYSKKKYLFFVANTSPTPSTEQREELDMYRSSGYLIITEVDNLGILYYAVPTILTDNMPAATNKLILSCPLPDSSYGSGGSIRFYYYNSEDKKYHFVFGQNFTESNISNNTVTTTAYLSLTESRSKTVYDAQGEPSYKVVNYAKSYLNGSTEVPAFSYGIANYCVPQSWKEK
jgi:hypothetical protein